MSTLVPLRKELEPFLQDYLPVKKNGPFVTLTYAASLDSRISAGKGQQTIISHLETKTMTHYIRSKHDGILVGVGTAIADDPGLNCRYKYSDDEPVHLIRPIVVDPSFRWHLTENSRVLRTAKAGDGLAPWVVVSKGAVTEVKKVTKQLLEEYGGKVIEIETEKGRMDWENIISVLGHAGISSLMVEGGASVINSLLNQPHLIDSVILTIGPVYLGSQGVEVSPSKHADLIDVSWWYGIQDSVLAARLK